LLGDREDAEEAMIDVFVRAWRGARDFQGGGAVRNWLYRIATHLAIDRQRRRRRTPDTRERLTDLSERDSRLIAAAESQPEAVFFTSYQQRLDRAALCVALQHLTPEERVLIHLRYVEECSYEQMCDVLERSLPWVKTRLHRTRQRLRRLFEVYRESDHLLERHPETEANAPVEGQQLLAL
jgi:RNA polymerase sigma-70 factor, ECF subfamily